MKRFTPVWKTAQGDLVIFPATNTVHEQRDGALEQSVEWFLWMVAFGLSIAPPLEFEMDEDGHAEIVHLEASFPRLGPACVIGGPRFEGVAGPCP